MTAIAWIMPLLLGATPPDTVNVSCGTMPDLAAVEHARSAAIAGHDAGLLDRLYAPEFTGSLGPARTLDKAGLLAMLARNDGSTAFAIDQLEPMQLGDGLAAIRGRLTGRRGEQVVSSTRFLHVYRRFDCAWRIISGASAPETGTA